MTNYIKKGLKIIGIFFVIAIIYDICQEWKKLSPFNQAPLNIKTFDGTNSPYHPSVKYFANGWNNYKYWMAETPFYPYTKPYRDRNECPSIHVSDDGYHWSELIENPLDNLDSTGVSQFDYFSDPHLVEDGDTLECWYRINKRYGNKNDHGTVILLCKKSIDGKNWFSDTLFNFSNVQEKEFVSPAIIHNDSTYDMWYVDNDKVFYMQSKDPKKWSNAQICEFKGLDETAWHIDVVYADNFYWLLCYDIHHNRLTLWNSTDKKCFNFVKILLEPSLAIGSFYQNALYRSCLLKENDNQYRVYFSAFNEEMTFLGLMEGSSFENLQVVDIDSCHYSNFKQFLNYYLLTRWRAIYFRFRHIKK